MIGLRRCLTGLSLWLAVGSAAAYTVNTVTPQSGGCPVDTRFSTASPINRRWSTSLPPPPALYTLAAPGTADQINEVQQVILTAFAAWTGVSGTLLNAVTYPSALSPLGQTSVATACSDDSGGNLTGNNTICFNQASQAFTPGVLAFTRVFVASAPGQTLGSVTSTFAGQILQADVLVRNDGAVSFATPGALGSHPDAYDLETVLMHELGHFFGLEHSPVWRAMMAPFAPAAGTFLPPRPSAQTPDAPLREDDRTGLRVLYPDPLDTMHTGIILGRVLPANLLSLATVPAPAAGQFVSGLFAAHVVAVDADTGEVVAGAIAGWSCPNPAAVPVFDGSYRLERLPLGRNYNLFVEPLNGAISPAMLGGNVLTPCSTSSPTPCQSPPPATNFVVRPRSGS
jgi:hypothetical protein